MTRAVAIVLKDDAIALIKRERDGRLYYTFPGGKPEAGESVEQAVVREISEEPGLQVEVRQLVALVHFQGNLQYHFLVDILGGEFGTGTGPEITG